MRRHPAVLQGAGGSKLLIVPIKTSAEGSQISMETINKRSKKADK